MFSSFKTGFHLSNDVSKGMEKMFLYLASFPTENEIGRMVWRNNRKKALHPL